MDIFVSQVKVVDVDDLKKKLLCNPREAEKCVILKLEMNTTFRGKEPNYVRDVVLVFGKENIEDIEIVSEKLLLVTLLEGKKHIADSVRSFSCGFSSISYYVHCMHSVSAYVEAKLFGIPRFVAAINIQLLVLQITKTLPFLSNITMEYMSFCSNSNSSGYYLVKGTTKDVASSKPQLDKCIVVPFLGFDGKMECKITGPVRRRTTPKIPVEDRNDICVQTYW